MATHTASSTAASLAPGFRFHPTDEELVRYYLRRKICRKPLRFDAISQIDIYKLEPWDLPGKSKLKSRDLEWYFFSVLDKKYGNGSKTNRATDRGYWKTTGKDRAVYHRSRIVGKKKTLIYHCGRAPRGERTNWVMHEYRLVDEELVESGIVQDAFVLCRVFQKSGSGPKNGEQYGAPFIEEEWENEEEESVVILKDESADDGAYLDENDLEQILGTGNPCKDSTPLNIPNGGDVKIVEEPTDLNDDAQKVLVGMGENRCGSEHHFDQKLFDLAMQHNLEANSVKQECIGEPSYSTDPVDLGFLLDEPFVDATDKLQSYDDVDRAYFKTEELKDYLKFYDSTDDIAPFLSFDPSEIMGSEGLLSDPAFFSSDYLNGATQQVNMAKQHVFDVHGYDVALSTSSKQQETESACKETSSYKGASRILDNINAPPAFASEFPTKAAVLRLNFAAPQSSSSPLRVTAGMIQMRNPTLSNNGIDFSFSKNGHVDIIFSFGLSQGNNNSLATQQSKAAANSLVSRGWVCFLFVWIMLVSFIVKLGSYICVC